MPEWYDQIYYVQCWAIKENRVEECRRLMIEMEELAKKPGMLPERVKFLGSFFTMAWTGGGHTCEAWLEMTKWGDIDRFRDSDFWHVLMHRRSSLVNYSLPHYTKIMRRPQNFAAWYESSRQLFARDEKGWTEEPLEVRKTSGE